MTVKKHFVRCIMTAKKDGQRCGRMAPADTQVCAVHARGSQSPVIPTPDISPLGIIQALMRDSDPAIRLRAVDMFQKYEERKGCAICEARESDSRNKDDVFARATHEQLTELSELLARW